MAAINALLGETLATCTAKEYRAGFFHIMTSMALRDDMLAGESYFITELKSLRRMLDATIDAGLPCLCIVDEVLRGTNTGERIAASSALLRRFAKSDCVCIAATHDIELTYILGDIFTNVHFTEAISDGSMQFDYLLKQGRSTSTNAIKLLSVMGYDPGIVESANSLLDHFRQEGKWI